MLDFIFFSRDASATTAPSRARVAECRGALARVRGARHEVETPRRNVTWRHDEEDAREKVSATPTTRGGERARRGGPKFRAARANRARARSRRGRPSDMCARGCESSREALRGAGARREQARSRNLARGGRDRGEGHIASTWTRWRGAPEARESSETRVHAMVLHRLGVRERSRARDMRPLRAGISRVLSAPHRARFGNRASYSYIKSCARVRVLPRDPSPCTRCIARWKRSAQRIRCSARRTTRTAKPSSKRS